VPILFPQTDGTVRMSVGDFSYVFCDNPSPGVVLSSIQKEEIESVESWNFRLECLRLQLEDSVVRCRGCLVSSFYAHDDTVPADGLCSHCRRMKNRGLDQAVSEQAKRVIPDGTGSASLWSEKYSFPTYFAEELVRYRKLPGQEAFENGE